MKNDNTAAFATLDIGTSQIKLGVYCPAVSNKIEMIGSLPAAVIYGTAGAVTINYADVREKSFELLQQLGIFLATQEVKNLYLGICGHVSSLLEWNRASHTPPADPFPIWLDTTNHACLDEFRELMGNGKSRNMIGTFLPAGTNWLLTKLMHRRKKGFTSDSIFLQVSDALFYELSGNYQTHFSSQISMVDLRSKQYAPELMQHLKLGSDCVPAITYDPVPLPEQIRKQFSFPEQSAVFPAMADLYTALYGLRLKDRQGFMLANTSEQAGAFYADTPDVLDNFLNITFNTGFINYGSTNTGANVVNWYLAGILEKEITPALLEQLTNEAAAIQPSDTPIVLPYLQGERAPLWDSSLTASVHELRSTHTTAHLFRAILESIAFARRQCFEQLGIDDLHLIKIGGGSSKNNCWNAIRATVLNKPVAVANEKELSMAGIMDYMMEFTGSDLKKLPIHFSMVQPDPNQTTVYDLKYARFLSYQKS